MLKCVKKCRNVSKSVEMCQKVSKRVEQCRTVSKRVELCRNVSKRVEMCRNVSKSLKCVKMCRISTASPCNFYRIYLGGAPGGTLGKNTPSPLKKMRNRQGGGHGDAPANILFYFARIYKHVWVGLWPR